MKQLVLAGVMALALAGCGRRRRIGRHDGTGGLPAANGRRQKSGKITLDQLTSARDKLFDETQSAQEKEDWTAYCKAIDATRAELGL